MKFAQLITIAILVEAVWENLKMVWQNGKLSIDRIGSLVLGITICLFAKMDIFSLLNIPLSIAYLGSIFTGIICSRGANFVHDLYKKIIDKKEE